MKYGISVVRFGLIIAACMPAWLASQATASSPVEATSGRLVAEERCPGDFVVATDMTWSLREEDRERFAVETLRVTIADKEALGEAGSVEILRDFRRWTHDQAQPRRIVYAGAYCPDKDRVTLRFEVLNSAYRSGSVEEILHVFFARGEARGLEAHRARNGYGGWVPAEEADIPRP